MAKLNKSLVTLARQAGGSFKTVSDRMKIADRLADSLLKMNIQIRDAGNLKTNHIALYVRSRLAEKITKRTMQNNGSNTCRSAYGWKNLYGKSRTRKIKQQCIGYFWNK